jgi:hypothetical protein
MATLEEWVAAASAELGVDGLTPEQQQIVLDVARDVAHNVLRPGAPVTTFLLGVAVGRGADLASAANAVTALATAEENGPE